MTNVSAGVEWAETGRFAGEIKEYRMKDAKSLIPGVGGIQGGRSLYERD